MADSVNAFTVYSSLELQINEFVQQLNRASQILDSTLHNMSSATSSLNIQPVAVHTEIIPPDISTYEIPAEILSPDRPDMPIATPFSVPSEIENPDIPAMPEEPTYTVHTETEPIEQVTVPPPDDRNFIQKIKDSFNNLGNIVKSVTDYFKNTENAAEEMGQTVTETSENGKKSMSEYKSDVMKLAAEYRRAGMDSREAMKRAYREIDKSEYDFTQNSGKRSKETGNHWKNIGQNISKIFKNGIEGAKNALKELPAKAAEALRETGEKLKGIAETVAKAGSVAIGAVSTAVVAFGKSTVDTGMSFDKSMSQVAATMGKSVDEVSELREFAQEMGRTTAFSAKESADALNYMALAGYDAETAMSMLPNVLNLAAAGNMDLALASDMITDSQSALGLSLEETTQLVDKMAKASSKSNTSVSQLGDAILTVGGTAKKLKGGTTELATVLGILADNGIKGSEGGTALRNIMNSLISPTEDARIMLDQMGASLYDSEGNMRSLNDVFIDLRNGMNGLATQAEKDKVLTTIFNARDLKSAEALISNVGDRFNELSGAIGDSAGAADAMAKTQLDNLAGDVTLFQSALEGAKIAISDHLTPALRDFVKLGSKGMEAVAIAFKASDFETALERMGKLLQPYIDKLIGKVVEAVPKIVSVAVKLISVFGQAIVKNVPKLADSAVQLLKGFAENIAENAPEAIRGFSDMLKKVTDWIKKNGKTLISSGMEMVKSIAKGISENLPDMIGSATEVITFIAEQINANIGDIINSGLEILEALGQGILDNLPIIVDSAISLIQTLCDNLLTGENLDKLLSAGLSILETITEIITENLDELVAVTTQIIDFLCTELLTGENLTNLIDSAVDILTEIGNAIIDNVDEILLAAEQIIKTICDELLKTENLSKIIETGAKLLGKIIVGLCQIAGKLLGFASLMYEEVDNALEKINWGEIGVAIVEGICSGMLDCDFVLKDYLDDFGDNWLTGIQDVFDIHSPSKLMKDEVGKYLALGIGEGFAENAGKVEQQISGAVSGWTSVAKSGDLMDNLINGVKSKSGELKSTVEGVAESIRETFEKPVTVSTDITANGHFNRLKVPDISTVAENIYTVNSEPAQNVYPTESESPITVENLNITVEGAILNSEYEMERFIDKIADRLQARTIRKNRGTGGVLI